MCKPLNMGASLIRYNKTRLLISTVFDVAYYTGTIHSTRKIKSLRVLVLISNPVSKLYHKTPEMIMEQTQSTFEFITPTAVTDRSIANTETDNNDELQNVLSECVASENTISPPRRVLDPVLYANLKKIMTDNLGKWKGGNSQLFVFPFNSKNLLDKLLQGERPNFRREWHYFPTPESVIDQMLNICIPSPSERLLEPSAGRAAIVEYAKSFMQCDQHWSLIEPNPTNRDYLTKNGYNLVHDYFESYVIPDNKFDTVYANPPFFSAAKHLIKMAKCVTYMGSVVSVLPSNFETSQNEIVKHLTSMFTDVNIYPVPDKSFIESGTAVSTVIMHASGRE